MKSAFAIVMEKRLRDDRAVRAIIAQMCPHGLAERRGRA
jgi:hypothetical protein